MVVHSEFGYGPIPSGELTFLFSDVTGSTALWARDPNGMSASLRQHDEILARAMRDNRGYVFNTAGDSFAVAFEGTDEAVTAAMAAHGELRSLEWAGPELGVRMALHRGRAEERDRDYFGPVVNLAARLEAAAHPGQILATAEVVSALDIEATDLGPQLLKDLPTPVRIFELASQSDDARSAKAAALVRHTPNNISPVVGPLIGRHDELAYVREAVEQGDVVTIVGPGGMGKTRLATEVARASLATNNDGVWFIDLRECEPGSSIAGQVARTLGFQSDSPDVVEALAEHLTSSETLVVLDNAEHVLASTTELVSACAESPGHGRLIVTSRHALGASQEKVVRLSPLECGDRSGPAIDLFIEAAQRATGSFHADNEDRAAIAQLCRGLDGLPLALELAAGRSSVLSPSELLDGLDRRFELLGAGGARQSGRALDEVIAWSYELLDEAERSLFRALGAFVGSFDLAAVCAVSNSAFAEAADLVESLVASSLVVSERADQGTRFRLLDSTAAYAKQMLVDVGESTAVQERHAEHFLLACRPHTIGVLSGVLVHELDADRANVIAAIRWFVDREQLSNAAGMLFSAYEVLVPDGELIFELAKPCFERSDLSDPVSAIRTNMTFASAAIQIDDFATVGEVLRRSLEAESPLARAFAQTAQAYMFMQEAAMDPAIEALEKGRRLLAEVDDSESSRQVGSMLALVDGWRASLDQQWSEAIAHFVECRAFLGATSGAPHTVPRSLYAEGLAHAELGRSDAALNLAAELDKFPFLYSSPTDVRIVGFLADNDRDHALPLVRNHALDAVSGRVTRKANDALLFLSILDRYDDDSTSATRLVIASGQPRSVTLVGHARQVASSLDVEEQYEESRVRGLADRGLDGQRARRVLREECLRRSWL